MQSKDKKVVTTKKKEKNIKKENSNVINILELVGIIVFILIVLIFFKNTIIWNIVVLLLILTVLVFVHEGGHFIAAKKCGVHVYEFAIGMGPKVLGFKRKNDPTEYNLRLLPIGGFCQMAGEDDEDDENLPKDKFLCNQPKLKKSIILTAGVCMNFITAIVILFFIALIYGSSIQTNEIVDVTVDSPAYVAGIRKGDKVVGFNGHKITSWDKLALYSAFKNPKNKYEYKIEHKDGTVDTYKLKPKEYVQIDDKTTVLLSEEYTLEMAIKEYKLDKDTQPVKLVGIASSNTVKHGFINSIKYAFSKFGNLISSMFIIIGGLFTGGIGLDSLSGPVGMYTIVDQAAAFGLANILFLAGYLSINLGVINILPFPAFDGGRLFFVIIEAITRHKVDSKIEGYFHTIGFMLLMLLMLYITFQDVIRLI